MNKIIIYQLFVRLFGNKKTKCRLNGNRKQNGVGKFNDITNTALKEIKKMGISHIWYTGVIEHAIVEGYKKFKIPNGNPQIIKGRAGSPYAIKDYYDVNPDLATNPRKRMLEWKALITRTHQNGLKVIIDFVPNHVAREYYSNNKEIKINDFGFEDNPSMEFSNQNDCYYIPNKKLKLSENSGTVLKHDKFKPFEEFPAKVTGNDKFSNQLSKDDWYDTIKLNYGIDYLNNSEKKFEPIPSVWWKMLDILYFWSEQGIDGFRCDMAEMIPIEFWEWVIPQIKEKYPDIIFIAEIYKPDLYKVFLQNGLFDFLYDKIHTYDTLRNILQHGTEANSLSDIWKQLDGINDKMLRFLENHDEQRIASDQFLKNPFYALPGIIFNATSHNGPVMIYFGQEVGEHAAGTSGYSGNDGRTTIYDYWHVPEHQKWMNNGRFNGKKLSQYQKELRKFYSELFNFCLSYTAFSSGQFYDLMWVNNHDKFNKQKIYAYLRYDDKNRFIIVLNFDKSNTYKIKIFIPEHAFSLMGVELSTKLLLSSSLWNTDLQKFTAQELNDEGFFITLKPHSGKIYELKFRL